MAPAKAKKPKRSAFDPKQSATGESTVFPQQPGETLPYLGKRGTEGINVAGQTPPRNRTWEKEHQYGQGYSVKGVRPDVYLWLVQKADNLGVPVAEVAVYSLRYSMELVDSGNLIIKAKPSPRGSLFTLFPAEYERSTEREVDKAIAALAKRIKIVKETRKEAEKRLREKWRSKTTTWIPFDQELKSKIVEQCRDRLPQGEFITFLLEKARADYQAGILVFRPIPKSSV